MQMSKQQVDRLLKQKAKLAARASRFAKAKAAAPGCNSVLALEILKAQERASARKAKRDANVARIRGE